jgi:hypothetical protein
VKSSLVIYRTTLGGQGRRCMLFKEPRHLAGCRHANAFFFACFSCISQLKSQTSAVIEKVLFVWCVTCKATRRVGELGDCLQNGQELDATSFCSSVVLL